MPPRKWLNKKEKSERGNEARGWAHSQNSVGFWEVEESWLDNITTGKTVNIGSEGLLLLRKPWGTNSEKCQRGRARTKRWWDPRDSNLLAQLKTLIKSRVIRQMLRCPTTRTTCMSDRKRKSTNKTMANGEISAYLSIFIIMTKMCDFHKFLWTMNMP